MPRALRASMGELAAISANLGFDIEDSIRYMSLANRLKEARLKKGWSLKEVAAKLRCPQYRIRDAEKGPPSVRAWVLSGYVDLLGLARWFARWRRRNPALAERIECGRFGKPASTGRGELS